MPERERPTTVTVAAVGSLIMALCCGGMCGGVTTAAPALFEAHKKMMTSLMDQAKAQLEKEKTGLRQKRAATRDPQQIAAIDKQIAALDQALPPDISGIYEGFLAPKVRGCYLFEGLTTLILYLLIFIAGCGMFPLAPWARLLGMIAAAARIVTAVIYAFLTAFIVMPAMAAGFKKMMDGIAQMQSAAGTPAPPMPDMSGMLAVQGGIGAVIMLLLSIAWPVTMLILLNTKSAKEAFSAGAPSEGGSFQPGA